MKKIFLMAFAILLLLCPNVSNGQSMLGVQIGAGHIARQDLIFSPSIHRDVSPVVLGLEYAKTKGKRQQCIEIQFAQYTPRTGEVYDYYLDGEKHTTAPHAFTMIEVDYTLGKRISEKAHSGFVLGGLLSADVQMLNYAYGRIGSFGYFAAFGAGLYAEQQVKIGEKSRLSGHLKLPLVSWVARSPYLVNDDEFIENISSHSTLNTFASFVGDGGLATLNEIQSAEIEGRYNYQFNKRWALGFNYSFEFLRIREPRPLLSFQNTLQFSINLTL